MNNILCKLIKVAVCLVFFLSSFALMYPDKSFSSEQRIIEGAKKEGRLVLYTSMNLASANILLQAFNKKYPFLKTAIHRSSSNPLLTRITQETRAKKCEADAITASFPIWNDLAKKEMLLKYKSPESTIFPQRLKDPEGLWTTLYVQVCGIAYNTKMVSPDVAPKKYEDLLHPRWKGKLGLDANDQAWFSALLEAMGKQNGLDFMQSLGKQDLYIRVGKPLLSQLMAAGEFPILVNSYASIVVRMKKQGAPVEWVPGNNPIPASIHLVGVYAHTSRPNAAKLYIDFLLSDEGQKMLMADPISKYPSKPGMKSEYNQMVEGYELNPVHPSIMANYAAISKQYADLIRRKR